MNPDFTSFIHTLIRWMDIIYMGIISKMEKLPLLRRFSSGDVISVSHGSNVSVEMFLQHVANLSAKIPGRRYVINLCADRYNFLVGFSAAICREQTSLLPHSGAPEVIMRIAEDYSDLYCIKDDGGEIEGMETFKINLESSDESGKNEMPFIPQEHAAVIAFTSGSTGRPGSHPKTWGSLVKGADLIARRFMVADESPMYIVCTTPQQHMYGLETSIMLPIQYGCPVYSGKPLFPEDIRIALELGPAPRVLITTPLHLRSCVENRVKLPPLKFIISATAPLSKQMAAEAESMFNAKVYEIYGCTEAGSIASRRTINQEPWRSFDGVKISKNGGSPFVSGGHVSEPTPLGDKIELKSDNEFFLHGRSADMVNVAGKRISLGDLNHKLSEIKGVDDGVFFHFDDSLNKVPRLMAFVVAPGKTSRDIINELRLKIDPVFLPRPLVILGSLPREGAGKIPRERLNELARRHGGV